MSNKKDREDGMKLLKREIESNDVELTGGKITGPPRFSIL